MIQNVAGGEKIDTCPWLAFSNPVCADVVNAFAWYESGQVALFLGNDPPSHIVQGLAIYRAAYNEAQADRLDRRKKK
jgi:hypothetical protein